MAHDPVTGQRSRSRFGTILIPATLATVFAGCATHRPVAAGPVALFRESPPHRTYYEHQDHRMLPIGTKIYYDGDLGSGAMWIVRPTDQSPATFGDRQPDIVVVGPNDPRGNAVIERTR
jgi:hypothetical protein